MRQRIISTKYHGIADYLTGLFIAASPWLTGYADNNEAMWIGVIIGCLILLTGIFTKYEVGVFPVIPMKMHLQMDILIGVFLIISPFLFSVPGVAAWIFVIIGVLEICAGLFTHTTPYFTKEKIS